MIPSPGDQAKPTEQTYPQIPLVSTRKRFLSFFKRHCDLSSTCTFLSLNLKEEKLSNAAFSRTIHITKTLESSLVKGFGPDNFLRSKVADQNLSNMESQQEYDERRNANITVEDLLFDDSGSTKHKFQKPYEDLL